MPDRSRIPSPEEFGQQREEQKKGGFLKRLLNREPLNVEPEIGEQKEVSRAARPPPPREDVDASSGSGQAPPAEQPRSAEPSARQEVVPAAAPARSVRRITLPQEVVQQRGEDEVAIADPVTAEVVTELAPPPPPIPLDVLPAEPDVAQEAGLSVQEEPVLARDYGFAPDLDQEPALGEDLGSDPRQEPVLGEDYGYDLPEPTLEPSPSRVGTIDVAELEREIGRLRELLESHGIDPDSEVARVETPVPPVAVASPARASNSLLAKEVGPLPADLAADPNVEGTLFFLTNRFAPMKVAVRVLANLRVEGQWPPLREFQLSAAIAARDLGLRLRKRDQQSGMPGLERRATGFPVGPQEKSSLDAFIDRFTISVESGLPAGPLAVMGLASVQDGRVALTEAGWNLALASSPLIDGVSGRTLSETEQRILIAQLSKAPGELKLVREFLGFVRIGRGIQTILDGFLADEHPEWGDDVPNWRSAMLGRLRELDVVDVEGRGARARITLSPSADLLVD